MAASENLASSLQALLIRFQQEFSEKVASVEERLRERETRLAREWEALETEKKSLLKLRQEMEREREQLQRDREQLEREREAVVERTRLQATEISTNDEGAVATRVETSEIRNEPVMFASRDIRYFPSSERILQMQRERAEKEEGHERQRPEHEEMHKREPPEPDETANENVVVTYVTTPNDFLVHLVRDKAILTDVMNKLQEVGERPDLIADRFWEGRLYCGQFTEDDMWYRVKVQSNALSLNPQFGDNPVVETSVCVMYVDFGNSEWLPANRLRLLPQGLETIQPLARHCCLVDVQATGMKWSDEAVRLFEEVTSEIPLEMKIFWQVDKTMFVDLLGVQSRTAELGYPQCSTVSELLLSAGHASVSGASPQSEPVGTGSLSYLRKLINPSMDTHRPVVVTHFLSLQDLHVQLLSDQVELNDLMADIQNEYHKLNINDLAVTDPQQGEAVCSLFSDQKWYRAEVIDVLGPRKVSVAYVDYGNVEEVELFHVKKLSGTLIRRLPALALQCSLVDVGNIMEPEQQCPAEVLEQVNRLCSSSDLTMVVKGVRGTVLDVEFFEPSVGSVNQLLLQTIASTQKDHRTSSAAFAGRSEDNVAPQLDTMTMEHRVDPSLLLSQNASVSSSTDLVQSLYSSSHDLTGAIISHIDSPSQFYVHLSGAQNILQDVMMKVADHCNTTNPPQSDVQWILGSRCCALFSEDHSWNRAQVKMILHGNRYKVFYVDFGNSETVSGSDMRTLPYDCRAAPAQALPSFIYGVTPVADNSGAVTVGGWSIQAVNLMNDLLRERAYKIELQLLTLVDRRNYTVVDFYHSYTDMWPYCGRVDSNVDSGQPTAVDICFSAQDGQTKSLRRYLIEKGFAKPHQEASMSTYLPPKIPSSRQFPIIITFVDKDCLIYAHDASTETDEIDMVTGQLQTHLNETSNVVVPAEQWQVGQSCCARFAQDNNWYRARIVAIVGDRKLKVFYVDFGNCDVVSVEWLHPEVAFQEIPCLSLIMQLQGLNKTSDNCDVISNRMLELLVDNRCCASIVGQPSENPLLVSIDLPDGTKLLDALATEETRDLENQQLPERDRALHYQLASPKTFSVQDTSLSLVVPQNGQQEVINAVGDKEQENLTLSEESPVREAFVSTTIAPTAAVLESSVDADDIGQVQLPSVGVKFAVQAVHVLAPDTIYLQRLGVPTESHDVTLENVAAQLDNLYRIQAAVSECSFNLPQLTESDVKADMVCAACYTQDNVWYRARVVELFKPPSGLLLIKIYYIDYGTSEVVTPERIRKLPAEFLGIPAQAFLVKLPGIEPVAATELQGPQTLIPNSIWSTDSLTVMTKLVTRKKLVACIESTEVTVPNVSLTEEDGTELVERLVESGYARKSH